MGDPAGAAVAGGAGGGAGGPAVVAGAPPGGGGGGPAHAAVGKVSDSANTEGRRLRREDRRWKRWLMERGPSGSPRGGEVEADTRGRGMKGERSIERERSVDLRAMMLDRVHGV